MAAEPIKKVTLKDRTVKYRLVYDAGTHSDGRRRQVTRTYPTLREARAELARVRHQRSDGSYVAPDRVTLNSYLDTWLAAQAPGREVSTMRSYEEALKPVRAYLGTRKLQSLDASDITALVEYMRTTRRRGQAGAGLAPRMVALTLTTLRRAFRDAMRDKKMASTLR